MMRSISASFSSPLQTSLLGAQALWWPCSGRLPPAIVFLFVVGNPGLASYYTPFLTALHASASLRGRIEILCVSHRGHSSLPLGSHPFYGSNEGLGNAAAKGQRTGLKDQISHKIAVLDTLRAVYPNMSTGAPSSSSAAAGKKDGRTKIIVGGHSVGAYIALEMLKQRPDHVDGLHLYFPTLSWIGKTPNARRLSLLFYPIVPTLILPIPLFLLSLLPLMILLPLIRILGRQPPSAARTTAELLTTKGAVSNALKMAAEEMRQIGRIDDETKEAVERLRSKGGSVRAYYSKGEEDGWVPSWLREQTEKALGLETLVLPASLSAPPSSHMRKPSHAFSIDDIRAARRGHAGSRTVLSPMAGGATGFTGNGTASPSSIFNEPLSPTSVGAGGRTPTGATMGTPTTLRRRKSLLHAKARRSLTGGIIIETEDDEASNELIDQLQACAGQERENFNPRLGSVVGGKARVLGEEVQEEEEHEEEERPNPRGMLFGSSPSTTADKARGGAGATMVKSPEEELQDLFASSHPIPTSSSSSRSADEKSIGGPSSSTPAAGAGDLGIQRKGAGRQSRPLITSTVCQAGMPHAFCLRHGEHMARITAAWLVEEA